VDKKVELLGVDSPEVAVVDFVVQMVAFFITILYYEFSIFIVLHFYCFVE
jgi:hypothetical protein